MNHNFLLDPRKLQDIIAQPIWEAKIKVAFPSVQEINFDIVEALDRERAIDVECRFDNGMLLYGQIKTLSYAYSKYKSVTVEYMNNPSQKEEGDWFHLGSHFYGCGYCTLTLQKIIDSICAKKPQCQDEIENYITTFGVSNLATNNDGLYPWIILSWLQVVLNTQQGIITWEDNVNRDRGLANFKYTSMNKIPVDCIIAGADFETKLPGCQVSPKQISAVKPYDGDSLAKEIESLKTRMVFLEQAIPALLKIMPRKRQHKENKIIEQQRLIPFQKS